MRIHSAIAGSAVWLLACSLPLVVHAEAAVATSANPTLEEIVVTAEHRDSSLQKVALPVTVISGETIARSGSTDIGQILQSVPSLVMQNVSGANSTQSVQGSGAPPNITIRGLGTDGPNRAGAVAVYQDGVLLQGGGGNSYDMNRVEVLRGPQGTLYGRGATGGAVNFITNEPTNELQATSRIQFGSYNLVGIQGMLNVPLADAWSTRIAFNRVKHNGYFSNGQSDEDSTSVRLKLRFNPSDAFSLTLTGVDYKSDSASPGVVDATVVTAPTSRATTLAGGRNSPNSYRKVAADIEWDMGFANLTYIAGYQTSHSYYSSSCLCFSGMNSPTTFAPGTYVVVDSPYNKTTTQELRIASKADSALTWVAGAYYYHNKLQQQFRLSFLPPALGAVDTPFTNNLQHYSPSSTGLFGELTYAINATTRLTAGVRETRDHIVQDACSNCAPTTPPAAVDAKNNRFDWKARVEHDLTADKLLYGTVSTGYRPSAVIQGSLTDIESVRAYEIGSKNKFGDKVTLNGAVFLYDYNQFQNVTALVINAAVVPAVFPIDARLYGAELEAVAQLSFNDKLTFTPAILSAKYTQSCVTCVFGMGPPAVAAALSPILTKDKDLPRAPKFSLSASYEHTFVLGSGARLSWNIDGHYQTKILTDYDTANYPVAKAAYVQGAYTVYNSSVTYAPQSGKYSVSVYGRNLSDEIYKTALGNSNPAGAPPSYAFFLGDPQTYGLMFSLKL
jgi:iron complex outermembrane receptor protein